MSSFVWHDLMTTDADRACAFYGEVFGWRFESIAMGPFTASLITHGDARLGTIMPEPQLPASHWMPYVRVANATAMCAVVKQLGGSVCSAPFDVPIIGRFAIASDPQGGWFSLIEDRCAVDPGPMRFGWDELWTGDVHAAATFYAIVFGWTFTPGVAEARTIQDGGRAIGGMRRRSLWERPAWIPSITSEDVSRSQQRSLRFGAREVAPGIYADPTGARFSIKSLSPAREVEVPRQLRA
ncbi:MAG TPA: VOC family protein [Kofleriaceae bacterium]|nr:VOC family protein [Kofleriaceae bacterium]